MIKITGGSGFIGSRLAARLARAGEPFELLDVEPSSDFPEQWRQCDVRDAQALTDALAGASAIVHLAAVHRDDVRPRSLYDEVNVEGTRNVCEAAEANGVDRIVFTSSVACYGFAEPNTDEAGPIRPFNDYGRTKAEAEEVLRGWQAGAAARRSLVIVRPTVVFGERNRGNVYTLLNQIASGRFVMVGSGRNVKSMAYVENVAAFLEHMLGSEAGVHVYNYIDKPDMDVAALVEMARSELGRGSGVGMRIPYPIGLAAGYVFDALSRVSGRTFPISAIRVRKFAATTQFATGAPTTGFVAPVPLAEALRSTIRYEFVETHDRAVEFYAE